MTKQSETFEWTGDNTAELFAFLRPCGYGEQTTAFWLTFVRQHAEGETLYRQDDRVGTAPFGDDQ